MIEFRDIQISDRAKIESALRKSDFMGCEYSFANNMAWKRLADSKICLYEDFYINCAFDNEDGFLHFVFPCGDGNYTKLFRELEKYAHSLNSPLIFTGVTNTSLAVLNELFPDRFSAEPYRDGFDYIYNTDDLINLRGKKYHAKRNHLARFREIDTEFSLLTEKDFDDFIKFTADNYNRRTDNPDKSSVAEQYAINTYLSYFDELGLCGGIIRIGGKTAAVTIGERLNSETFCVHIEKADTSYSGIYTGICNTFASECMEGFRYVNREEDMGIEGLRKSKLSYNPVFLLEKYIVTFK